MSTPVLTAAINAVKKKPVVFTYVYDPIAAGAGKTPTDHLPNITGTGSFPPVDDTLVVIRELLPKVQAVGTLYNSSEANSRRVIEVGRELFQKRGIKLEEVTVTNTSEVFQAAQVLTTRKIQAIWITGDNTALQAFEGIAKAAADARLPLVINDPEFTEKGALVAVGIGWQRTCQGAAKRVAQVLLGEKPKNLPFENVVVKKLVLNSNVARKLGITFARKLGQGSKRELRKALIGAGYGNQKTARRRCRRAGDPGTAGRVLGRPPCSVLRRRYSRGNAQPQSEFVEGQLSPRGHPRIGPGS